ncbi:hypothetical protein GSI_01255 [Ganoderma sinense ZZ0214-1]|uniref:Uncharacterized protein n=1 Tax=Ganoderma sinense ZZ0214-1 TaxID=1077348 RepID=A0A2G8SUV3_9APHY|nr:hypothetical protein GSI_01255 [Ganoderma sinense ZZ0214-1]
MTFLPIQGAPCRRRLHRKPALPFLTARICRNVVQSSVRCVRHEKDPTRDPDAPLHQGTRRTCVRRVARPRAGPHPHPLLPVARRALVRLPPVLAHMRRAHPCALREVARGVERVVRLEGEVGRAEDHLAEVDEAVADVRDGLRAVVAGEPVAQDAHAVRLVEHGHAERAVLGPQAHVPEPLGRAARPLLARGGPEEGVVRGGLGDEREWGNGGEGPVLGVVVADVG